MKKYTIEIYERGDGDKSARLIAHYDDLLALRLYFCTGIEMKADTNKAEFACAGVGFGKGAGPVTAVARAILRDDTNEKVATMYDTASAMVDILANAILRDLSSKKLAEMYGGSAAFFDFLKKQGDDDND